MNISDFQPGEYIRQNGYECFIPSRVNCDWYWSDPEIDVALAEANHRLGKLAGIAMIVPDVDMFVRMHAMVEATTSSRIEGTKTEIEEAILPETDIPPERRDDWAEVNNYVLAQNACIDQLDQLPVSTRMIRNAHRILMQGVRGSNKAPGEFRRVQNRIGGTSYEDATFVPPPAQEVIELMSDLEKFLQNDQIAVPYLIRMAIAHYQFETIHPFLDGNGRIGRLLITVYFVEKKLLPNPLLYLSDFFERYRSVYYDRLNEVRTKSNLTDWIKFFLKGVVVTATKSFDTFRNIVLLKEKIEREKLALFGKRIQTARKLMDHLYHSPIIGGNGVMELLNVSAPTANSLLMDFVKQGILVELTGSQRNRRYAFSEYFRLFSK